MNSIVYTETVVVLVIREVGGRVVVLRNAGGGQYQLEAPLNSIHGHCVGWPHSTADSVRLRSIYSLSPLSARIGSVGHTIDHLRGHALEGLVPRMHTMIITTPQKG